MKTMPVCEGKNSFGMMIDSARPGPVQIEKHGRGVLVGLAVEEYERLKQGGRSNGPAKTGREGIFGSG